MSDFNRAEMREDTTTIIGERIQFANQNAGLRVRFFIEELPDDKATAAAGHLKTYAMECIEIRQVGDDLTAATHPVTNEIKQRFPQEYQKWVSTKNNDFIDGTPLSAWPMISKGIVQEMNSVGIRSVENLAAVSDANIARFIDGHLWRKKAQTWLSASQNTGEAMRLAAENEQLKDRMAQLEARIAMLPIPSAEPVQHRENPLDGERIDEMKRGPGRPRKEDA